MRFCICFESSHSMGMGHLFRSLNLASYCESQGDPCLLLLNNDDSAETVLRQHGVRYETVDLHDLTSNWEGNLIRRHSIDCWINDRLATTREHARHVIESGARLMTFDDNGAGAELAQIHFAPLPCFADHKLLGQRVLRGIDYLILNSEIEKHKKQRFRQSQEEDFSLVVSIGGSDTYGVTLQVLEILEQQGTAATVVIGPSFRHHRELERFDRNLFTIKEHVPSLVAEFAAHDLAITAGGITPFEANAAGLPCIIVATELHEIANAQFLARLGSSRFAGYYQELDRQAFQPDLDISAMSRAGLSLIHTDGAANIHRAIRELC